MHGRVMLRSQKRKYWPI